MKRRDLLTAMAAGSAFAAAPSAYGADEGSADWPFPRSASRDQWTVLRADGFPEPVPAYLFDGAGLASGVPLGALGTGYFTLEGNGKLGHSSIYNDLVPPKKVFADWLTVESGTRNIPLSSARIAYWGHYPVADLRADFPEIPLEIGLRAFCPFIPGDAAASNTPAVLFNLQLRNNSNAALPLNLRLGFPPAPAGSSLAVLGQGVEKVDAEKGQYRLETNVAARGTLRVRFAVGWHAPSWRDSGNEVHYNRYSQRFRDAGQAADFALRNHDALLRRTLAWQNEIYRASLPGWLRDALVQGLYSLAKNSVWIARTRKDEWWGENGWFTHSESHTGCPIVETMVCRIHGHLALLFLFPELEATTLEAFRHFQISDGEIPFCFGLPTSMRDPRYHCQHPLNSGQYAQMIYQLFLRTGDRGQLTHFYDSARRAIRYQYSLDDCSCGLVHEQAHVRPGEAWPANQFYDVWPWEGTSSYVAGTWLATLAAGRAMAEAVGDRSFAEECASRLERAQRSFDERLWNGSYYRLWSDPANHRTSEVCLANQLMGQWCARISGLNDVLPPQKVAAALDSIERLNMKATSYGLVNGVTADGKPFNSKFHVNDFGLNNFIGENLCAAMTFLYHGREQTGLEIARRMYETLAVKTRAPWNQRCLISGETGLPVWGDDYYSDLAIWAMPMALGRESIAQFSRSGLAPRMIAAAKEA
jgi:uncharacterized protein (DUF608 family)